MESLALNDCLGDRFTLFETVEKKVRKNQRGTGKYSPISFVP